ncbi:MAG: hypothetical protein FD161_1746 [Limisphaerales bacterium]|nr:MAG: hypothetical protein FD161_1746 [Limisphaerales bacterium]KAG0509182.1 MAG: hypothetical protein E1N63_1665 [Limisphaerales bacterium]TXT52478.1 MAG: hypothetical protein FD140_702 [Limisphaerales bacterium]
MKCAERGAAILAAVGTGLKVGHENTFPAAAARMAALRPRWEEVALRQWAVGLAGCLALLVAVQPGEGRLARARLADQSVFPLLSVLSNQQSAAFHSTHAHSEWNHCARPLLEWTNTSRSPSSMASFFGPKAN